MAQQHRRQVHLRLTRKSSDGAFVYGTMLYLPSDMRPNER